MDKVLKVILIIVLIIALVCGGYYLFRYCKEKKEEKQLSTNTTSKNLEEKFENYVISFKDNLKEKGFLSDDVEDVNITFIQPEGIDNEVLVAQYEKDGDLYSSIYYENPSNDEIENIIINVPSQLVYLFNEKTSTFNYYLQEVNPETKTITYESITNIIKNNNNKVANSQKVVYENDGSQRAIAQNIVSHLSNTESEVYTFVQSEVPDDIFDTSRNLKDDFYQFDEVFIVPANTKINYTKIKIHDDEEKIKSDVKKAFENIKDKTELVTDEVKEDVDEKLEIVKEKVEEKKTEIEKDVDKARNTIENKVNEIEEKVQNELEK